MRWTHTSAKSRSPARGTEGFATRRRRADRSSAGQIEGRSIERHKRGQAYTLEGFLGAIILLSAMLLAQQALVISPTTAGGIDRDVRNQIHQEATDALVVSADRGDLYDLVRHWDVAEGEFVNATEDGGSRGYYNATSLAGESRFGAILKGRFADRGWKYNIELVHPGEDGTESTRLIHQGSPTQHAIAVTYGVAVFNDTTVTTGDALLRDEYGTGSDDYPVGPSPELAGEVAYAIVEVRVILWP